MPGLPLDRLRPTRLTLAAVLGLALALSVGPIREFIWRDLTSGLLRLDGLPRPTRGLALFGFALLLVMVVLLLGNDLLRALFPLLVLPDGVPGRGSLLPTALVPITLFVLAVAWAFALAGAIHAHPAIRIVVLALFLLSMLSWTGASLTFADQREVQLAWSVLLAVPLLFITRWRAAARPVAEFLFLFACTALILASSQAQLVKAWELSGIPLGFALLSGEITALVVLALPFLLLIGLDFADAGARIARFPGLAVQRHLPVVLPFLLLAMLAWRLISVGGTLLEETAGEASESPLLAYAGALAVPVITGLTWWLIYGRSRHGGSYLRDQDLWEGARRVAPQLIVTYVLPQLLSLLVLLTLAAVSLIDVVPVAVTEDHAGQLLSWITALTWWPVLVAVIALASTTWLIRRDRRPEAVYAGIFGGLIVWYQMTGNDGPLELLSWSGSGPVEFWWVIVLAAASLIWLLRRELTPLRMERLLFLLLLVLLMAQTDVISNPFSPVFFLSAIALLALGVVWDVLTVGSWANEGTPGLPRVSRIFLYLGYVLFTVTIINWALTTHDLALLQELTGGNALLGYALFGKPLLYAVIVATLAAPAQPEGNDSESSESALRPG